MKNKNKKINKHTWQIVKYKSDIALYARCNKCGFHYKVSKNANHSSFKQVLEPTMLYQYCPICGVRKKYYNDNVQYFDIYSWE